MSGASVQVPLRQLDAALSAHRFGMVLLDPVLRPLADDPVWGQHLSPQTQVPIQHSNVDPSVLPALLPLSGEAHGGPQLLEQSLTEALQELAPSNLRAGGGRRVGGWLFSHLPPSAVSEHLARLMIQTHGLSGQTVWLRVHDPAVLWLIWPSLSLAQQEALLGPIAAWHILDPLGGTLALVANEETTGRAARPVSTSNAPFQALTLTPDQWRLIDAAGAINQALRDTPTHTDVAQLRQAAELAASAAIRAAQLGFTDLQDRAFFARTALTVHPLFDQHPDIKALLATRAPEDYFAGLVADMGESQWQRIAAEMAKAPSSTPAPRSL